MVSLSNGSLSGAVSHKRPLENGYVPKYKPRKVSANRDFPPGCGPNAVPVNLKPEENGGSGPGILEAIGAQNLEMATAVVGNGAQISETANLIESEAVGSSTMTNGVDANGVKTAEMTKPLKLHGIKNSVVQNVVGSSGVKNSNIEMECQPHEATNSTVDVDMTESLVASVEKVMANANGIQKLMMEIQPLGIQLPNEVECLGHEAIDNTIEVDIAESLDALVGKVTTTIMSDLPSNVDELITGTAFVGVDMLKDMKSDSSSKDAEAIDQTMSKELNKVEVPALVLNLGVEGGKSKLNPGASVDKELLLGSSQVLSALCSTGKPEASIRPKDKYRRRRVSAVRDFPPNCGTNWSLPNAEEKQIVNSGNNLLDSTDKIEVEREATTSRKASGGGEVGEMLTTSQTERSDAPDDIHFEKETTKILNELTGATVEGGPMDFGECDRGSQHSNIEKMEMRPALTGLRTVSKAVFDTSIDDTGGPVKKEIIVSSPERNENIRSPHCGSSLGNESHREVVHGLMAAQYCPWRKATGLNARPGNSSQLQNSKAVASNNNFKADSCDADESPDSLTLIHDENRGGYEECVHEITPISMFKAVSDNSDNDSAGPDGKEIVVYSPREIDEMSPSPDVVNTADEVDREVVHGLIAAPCSPSKKGKTVLSNSDGGMGGERKSKKITFWRQKAKAVAKKSTPKVKSSGLPSKKRDKVQISYDADETPGTLMLVDNESNDHDGDFSTNSRARKKGKAVAKKSTPKVKSSGLKAKKRNKVQVSHDADESPGALVLADDEGNYHDGDIPTNSPASHKPQDFEINLPPFGPASSNHSDARHKVRETLLLFHGICRKLLQQEEANSMPEEEGKSSQSGKKHKRIDLDAAKIIKRKGKEVNTSKQILGQVPGVEVGDEFQYRVELAVVGIHRLYQAGIDWMKFNGIPVATSIVASGGYADDLENPDVLIYSGQGGNVIGKDKQPEDQKLERGNLALRNSITTQTPVRVVRGWKETKTIDPVDPKPKLVTTYVYDGVYTVKDYWTEKGPRGTQVFRFELRRNPGQPELAWKELKKSSKSKFRPGVCVTDISGGKEPFAICAVNTLDNEKPPPFNYTSKMIYPDWFRPVPPAGCDCTGRCSDSKKCRCAVRNGGEIPYNRNGAIVETKPLVYECGPHCKCPPSCYNRVTQRGIKFQIEIFKTESRGWGVRPLTSIPSGSFICEYAGELLEDKEAEQKVGNDEYLFDIGQNYSDCSLKPEDQAISAELMEDGGYTIDAAQCGNIGRFINHSCAPNLYAQNVIYDHDDKKMPHVMLFAMENIPPLKELTYHYNYSVDQITDSNGNIKVKKCFCGTAECTGRMY